jgi:hypothetical protein
MFLVALSSPEYISLSSSSLSFISPATSSWLIRRRIRQAIADSIGAKSFSNHRKVFDRLRWRSFLSYRHGVQGKYFNHNRAERLRIDPRTESIQYELRPGIQCLHPFGAHMASMSVICSSV